MKKISCVVLITLLFSSNLFSEQYCLSPQSSASKNVRTKLVSGTLGLLLTLYGSNALSFPGSGSSYGLGEGAVRHAQEYYETNLKPSETRLKQIPISDLPNHAKQMNSLDIQIIIMWFIKSAYRWELVSAPYKAVFGISWNVEPPDPDPDYYKIPPNQRTKVDDAKNREKTRAFEATLLKTWKEYIKAHPDQAYVHKIIVADLLGNSYWRNPFISHIINDPGFFLNEYINPIIFKAYGDMIWGEPTFFGGDHWPEWARATFKRAEYYSPQFGGLVDSVSTYLQRVGKSS